MMTKSWQHIHHFYADLLAGTTHQQALSWLIPMLHLVQAIEQSRYADHLHAWTSMHDLCIVQLPVRYPHDYPYLRITPRDHTKLVFRYIDTRDKDRQWYREVDGQDGFVCLERFLQQLHWFENLPLR